VLSKGKINNIITGAELIGEERVAVRRGVTSHFNRL